jgi:hypothetical protein
MAALFPPTFHSPEAQIKHQSAQKDTTRMEEKYTN